MNPRLTFGGFVVYPAKRMPSSRQVWPTALMIWAVQLERASSFLNLFFRYQPMKPIRPIQAMKNSRLGRRKTAPAIPAQLILPRLVSRLPKMKQKPVHCMGRKGLFSQRRSFFVMPSTSFQATLQQPATTLKTAPIMNRGEGKRPAMITMLMPKLRTGMASTSASPRVKPSIKVPPFSLGSLYHFENSNSMDISHKFLPPLRCKRANFSCGN